MMAQWQLLKADNLRVFKNFVLFLFFAFFFLIQLLPNLKSCQGEKPKAPISETINCVIFTCLGVSAPGICHRWQRTRALDEVRQATCSQVTATVTTLGRGLLEQCCFSPGRLCWNIVQIGEGGWMGRSSGHRCPPYSGPAPPPFH